MSEQLGPTIASQPLVSNHYMRKILQCQSCQDEEASRPTLVYSHESQKPQKSATCKCDQRLSLASAHFHSVASATRDGIGSYRGSTTANDNKPDEAFRKFESNMTKFSLRRAGVKHPERFMWEVSKVPDLDLYPTVEKALPQIVDRLSARITTHDYDVPSRRCIPPSEAELRQVSGYAAYVSGLEGTSTYQHPHLALATEAWTQGRTSEPQQAVFPDDLDPCLLMPQDVSILGSDEQAKKEMDDFLGEKASTFWEED